ncbi:hypothetical protein U879_17610 [Defluviimonas sp. 20V17]|uniref:Uncharacterized protein n=1 Tax=Allgaiera indica TaxID=765699 RepID=A0AAN4URF4_9RHOB|nr:hypothetical protein [Allgaiera indica]KDB02402.1 hypothetical protein U879_17610 [Defluviimonas sp. 20V17]GHE02200.1 hypothetical protein GCM10008024_20860 [Allgaiera indica]SDX06538.1 hypothetical protein SAMN05444006_109140 [Allgaiera indica]
MTRKMRDRLRLISRGLDEYSYVRFKHCGRVYIFMEGRWWTSPKV